MSRETKYTKEQIVTALTSTGGMVTHAAESLGCCYRTVTAMIKRFELQEELEAIKEHTLDIAESVIMNTMQGSDSKLALRAAEYYLRYCGRSRGYIKHEQFELVESLSAMMRRADKREGERQT